MKIAIYSPYLDTFGGGEKYMMTIAEVLSEDNEVDVLLSKHLLGKGGNFLKNELSKRFDLDLEKTKFKSGPIGEGSDFLSRYLFLKKYDLIFYLTDGSLFLPSSKKNILHIQSPLIGQPARSLWGRVKLKFWNLAIYNSEFTKNNSQNNWPISSAVIYPPVDTKNIKPLKKKNYILSVGRFFGYLKDKKHEEIIKTFISLYDSKNINEWSLHLAGAASEGDLVYLKKLKELAKDYPINFYPNLSYDRLIKLYGVSSIYWHASGYGEVDPTKMEHFGISTVEAMAAGCVPIVIGKGGQLEIVKQGISGLLCDDLEQIKKETLRVIEDKILKEVIAKKAIERSLFFSKEKFSENIRRIVKE